MPTILTDEEIADRVRVREQEETTVSPVTTGGGAAPAASPLQGKRFRIITPFAAAADQYISDVQSEDGRWYWGIPCIDKVLRGTGRGELMYVTGRSHSGKTQASILQPIANNPACRALVFTPDETATAILARLTAITERIPVATLEERVKARDRNTMDLLRHVAAERFPNLVVIDQGLSWKAMTGALNECQDFWQAEADVVMIDFLEQLPGDMDATGVASKSRALKAWCKEMSLPVVCLHQSSRSGGKRGQSGGMEAMRYGGENDAWQVVEVYRKRDDPDQDKWTHKDTLTVAVVKNKRPPATLGEFDLFIDPELGCVRELR